MHFKKYKYLLVNFEIKHLWTQCCLTTNKNKMSVFNCRLLQKIIIFKKESILNKGFVKKK